ncbi:MAG: DUF4276 family protein, partial [Odoribacter sp.]
IEGTADDNNGNLREAFSNLLSQEDRLKGKMPRIIMGDGKYDAVAKFNNHPLRSEDSVFFLLVDLDEVFDTDKEYYLEKLKNKNTRNFCCTAHNTFFMIQEVESWILSQPEVLDQYYKINISSKVKNIVPQKISNPSDYLNQLVQQKSRQTKSYHKVKVCVGLLSHLNLKKLREDFKEVDEFIFELSDSK